MSEQNPQCPVCGSSQTRPWGRDLRDCPACGHAFQWPAVVEVVYDAGYVGERYDSYPTTPAMAHLRVGLLAAFVPARLPVGRRSRILDVGYGNGAFVKAALSAGYDAAGFDIHGADYGIPTVSECLQPDGWDAVCCFDSLEHIPCLDEMRAVLRSAGAAVIAVPNRPGWFPYVDRPWKHHRPGEHLHYFSEASLTRLVGRRVRLITTVESAIRGGDADGASVVTYVF